MIRDLLDRLERVIRIGCILSFSIMAIMGVLQVLCRYFVNASIDFSEELARYSFVWSVFLGSVLCYRQRNHAAIEVFVNKMPARLRRPVLILSTLVCSAFFLLLVLHGTTITIDAMGQSTASLGISMALPYAAVPVGGFLLFIYSLEILYERIQPAKQ